MKMELADLPRISFLRPPPAMPHSPPAGENDSTCPKRSGCRSPTCTANAALLEKRVVLGPVAPDQVPLASLVAAPSEEAANATQSLFS